jgi:hypothetical protein
MSTVSKGENLLRELSTEIKIDRNRKTPCWYLKWEMMDGFRFFDGFPCNFCIFSFWWIRRPGWFGITVFPAGHGEPVSTTEHHSSYLGPSRGPDPVRWNTGRVIPW